MDRRKFLGTLAVGLAAVLSGCGTPARSGAAPRTLPPSPHPALIPTPLPGAGVASHAAVAEIDTGPSEVLFEAPRVTRGVALTIDDGYDAETVAAYVAFAQTTGIHLTFSPNGIYRAEWDRHAPVLRPLIEAGQVQIGNHTFDHADLTRRTDAQVRADIERNEAWIGATFGTSSAPYLRPPYGFYDERVRTVAAQAGFDRILMWNGTFGDSRLLTPAVLLTQAREYLRPGSIVLGHANHPTVTHLFGEITALIRQRDLTPQTLDEMFGTHRSRP